MGRFDLDILEIIVHDHEHTCLLCYDTKSKSKYEKIKSIYEKVKLNSNLNLQIFEFDKTIMGKYGFQISIAGYDKKDIESFTKFVIDMITETGLEIDYNNTTYEKMYKFGFNF